MFNNSGTLGKECGTGNSSIKMVFNNTATGAEHVDVQSGTLSVDQGGTSSGNFAISSGDNRIRGRCPYHTNGASMTGAGSMTVSMALSV